MAGYLIAVIAFLVPFGLSLTPLGRPGRMLTLGGALAVAWVAAAAAGRANDVAGRQIVPLWFIAGLIAFLYGIWCVGILLGLRLRRFRTR